nr:CRISPR-associated endoribonuclease Cas6 [Ardenticatena sp.]
MQIKITFDVPHPPLIVPLHYNRIVQGFIYNHLDEQLATFLHEEGWRDGKRRLPLFVFSRLFGAFVRRKGYLHFRDQVRLYVASPATEMLSSFVSGLVRAGEVHLDGRNLFVHSVEVLQEQPLSRPLRLEALSPITVYSTLKTPDGRTKTYYYAPQEVEFGQQVLMNLQRKIRAWTGEATSPEGATFRPVKVSNRNLVVARYKGTLIKGWTGIYELDAPEPYLRMALDAGLGAKNSQGFGFVTVWKPRKIPHGSTEETEK